MKLARHVPALSIALGMTLGLALGAAPAPPAEQAEQPEQPEQPEVAPEEEEERPGEALLLNGQLTQANEWIDKAIVDEQGEQVGELRDLAIDVTNGRVAYAIISLEHAEEVADRDLGDEHYAVPWEAFEPAHEEEALTLRVDLEQFDPEHSFAEGEQPEMTDEQWAQQTHQQYGFEVYWEENAEEFEAEPMRPEQGQRQQHEGEREDPMAAPNDEAEREDPLAEPEAEREEPMVEEEEVVHRDQRPEHIESLNELVGRDINDPQDESLAELEDLIVDLREGRIPYALLSYGGILGIGQDHVLVPWQALSFDAEEEAFVLDATEDQLDRFAFDPDDWPEMTDEQWASQIHTEFGQEPYWEVYGYAAPGEEEEEIGIDVEEELEVEEPGVQQLQESLERHMEEAGVEREQARQEAERLAQQFQQERPDEQAITEQVQQALEQAGVAPDQAQQTAEQAGEEIAEQLERIDEDVEEPLDLEQPEEERPEEVY